MPKLSLCLIVKPTKEESKLLDRSLAQLHKHVDEICITQAGISPNKSVTEIIKKYDARESFFKWIDDFSAARNFNFEQATGDYVLWIDSDDMVRNPELLPDLVEKMEREKIDATVMNYLYDFDENGVCTVKHLKTRLVKKGCVEWVGNVHEDFNPLREINSQFTDEIEILHITNEERIAESSERNLRIAQKFLDDNPKDPRSYWLMANALVMEGKPKEAMVFYEDFIETSQSDEEKYLAFLNLATLSKDENYALQALSIKPRYPNAYHKVGELLYEQGKYQRAIDMILNGLVMPRPDKSIIVYNPRDYDFNPMMILAKCYEELKMPKESLEVLKRCLKIYPDDEQLEKAKLILKEQEKHEKEIDKIIEKIESYKVKKALLNYLNKLDAKYASHPKITAIRNKIFVKTESTGKDITYYCGYTDKTWNPNTAKEEGVGGSEEAVIHLSKQWAELGYNVTVYNNCGTQEKVYDGVTYKPFWTFNPKDKTDILILWRSLRMLDYDMNADKIWIDLHDVMQEGEFTDERMKKVDKVFVKSQAHLDLFGNIDHSKFVIIPNGIDPKDFEVEVKRDPYLILNTSSPDRHLDATLDIFEKLIKEQPDKPWKLAWYYGWDNYLQWNSDDTELVEFYEKQNARFQKLVDQGRAEGGVMISHKDIAKKYKEAGIFLYPTQFYEIHCISAVKAQIAGCVPITSDFAALKETLSISAFVYHNEDEVKNFLIHTDGKRWKTEKTFGDIENVDKYVETIKEYEKLNKKEYFSLRDDVKLATIDEFNWKSISKAWIHTL